MSLQIYQNRAVVLSFAPSPVVSAKGADWLVDDIRQGLFFLPAEERCHHWPQSRGVPATEILATLPQRSQLSEQYLPSAPFGEGGEEPPLEAAQRTLYVHTRDCGNENDGL